MARKKTLSFFEKIADIRRRVELKKNSVNPHFRNKYLDLEGLLNALQPLLDEHGLLLTQATETYNGSLVVNTVIQEVSGPPTDEDGNVTGPHMVASSWPVEVSSNPQKIASGSTYARRYSLVCLLGLAAEDDDGNKAAEKPASASGGKSLLERIQG